MAQLTPQQTSHAGIVPSYAAAAGGGDTFLNDGRTIAHFKNGSGGGITVTINSLVNSNQGVDTNAGGVVGAGAERMFGPFNPLRFNANGLVSMTYSGVTSLTVGIFKLGNPG